MKKLFRYEMHLHTSRCSACAGATGEELVEAAKQKGYAGLVITNHFYHGNSAIDRSLSWRDFVGAYAEDYEKTKAFAARYDFDVFFGIEEAYGNGKEVLIYGLSPETIAETPAFRDMTVAEMSAFVHEHRGFLAYAHPFRHRAYITNPDEEPDLKLVDAIEAYNAQNAPEENRTATDFARRNQIPVIAGGDVHSAASLGLCGVGFYRRLYTEQNLLADLLAGHYQIITEKQET